MDPSSIPKISFTFLLPDQSEHPFTELDEVSIMATSLEPPEARINEKVMSIIENFSKSFVCRYRGKFKKTIKIRLSLSQERGLEIEDLHSNETYRQNISWEWLVVPNREIESKGMGHLKVVEVAEKIKRGYELKKGQSCTCIDAISFMLFQTRVTEAETVDLELKNVVRLGKKSTAAFRFPHMYLDMFERFKDKRKEDLNVCIVGPGLHRPGGGLGYCYQFVELKAMFPNGRFLLLDKDRSTIEYLMGQYKKINAVAYDPIALLMLTLQPNDPLSVSISNPYIEKKSHKAPDEFQQMLSKVKAEIVACAKSPPNAKKMLDGIGKAKVMMLGIDPEKVELREFDINTSAFQDEKFDVMVATSSISLVLSKGQVDDAKAVMQKYIKALNTNGSLYLDAYVMEILMQMLDCSSYKEVAALLAKDTGVTLEVDRIGLEDYLPGVTGDEGIIPCLEIPTDSKKDMELQYIPTYTIYVIQNKGDQDS